jgi:hypothetical protein
MGGIFGRNQVSSRIADLQVEWATSHQDISIRNFLIEKKKFSERQYRYILSKAPAITWEATSTEINNQLSVEKIRNHLEEAVRILGLSGKVAEIVFHRALGQLSRLKDELTPSELLALVSTVEKSQKVYVEAMGSDTYHAATRFAQVKELTKEPTQTSPDPQTETEQTQFNFDELQELIALKREFNAREKAIIEKAKLRTHKSTGTHSGENYDYTCLHGTSFAVR